MVNSQIVKITEKIQEFTECYVNLKDSMPIIELAGDFVSVIQFADKGIEWIAKRKFESFLNGLCYNNSSEEQLRKLIDYIGNEKRAEFIVNTFDKVLAANSRISCCIMGLLVNEMVGDNRELEYEDLLLIQALGSLNDFEIKNFIKVCKIKELDGSKNLNPLGSKELEEYRKTNDIQYYTWGCLIKNWESNGITESSMIISFIEDEGVDYTKELNGDEIEMFINKVGFRLFEHGAKIAELL